MKTHCTLHRILLSGALLFSAFSSCKDSPVEPPRKDPRTYTWTIDTLAYPGSFQTNMQDIWGSSPTDVYVVGHNDRNRGLMWHFDGAKWTDVKLSTTQGGNVQGPIDLIAISGFASNDIWAVGKRLYDNPTPPPNFLDSSLIIRFDGRQWREITLHEARSLNSIWGLSSSNLWSGGWTNKLFHYNGIVWQADSLPVIVQSGGFFQINAIEGNYTGEVFIAGNTHYNNLAKTVFYFFRKKMQTWTMVDSFVVQPSHIENKWGYVDLWTSPSGELYSCGRGIHKWNGTIWTQLFDHPNILYRIAGTSDNNIFVVGHLGTVLHFNGRDWYQFKQFANPDAVLGGVWTDGTEVFVVGFTAAYPQKTLIFHGK
jgi:hypothetical protein